MYSVWCSIPHKHIFLATLGAQAQKQNSIFVIYVTLFLCIIKAKALCYSPVQTQPKLELERLYSKIWFIDSFVQKFLYLVLFIILWIILENIRIIVFAFIWYYSLNCIILHIKWSINHYLISTYKSSIYFLNKINVHLALRHCNFYLPIPSTLFGYLDKDITPLAKADTKCHKIYEIKINYDALQNKAINHTHKYLSTKAEK